MIYGLGAITGLARLARLAGLTQPGRRMYRNATFFAAHVALDARAASRWLPPGLRLAPGPSGARAEATVFASHFPETSFGSVYDEAGIFFHVRHGTIARRPGVFCPWMVVTDDVALIVGRELLGYPKKMARITFDFGDGSEGTEVRADVVRRGRTVLQMRGRVGATVHDAPPMLGQRALNVRGALGPFAQRLVTFTPRETLVEVRSATATVTTSPSTSGERDAREDGRDPVDEMGLGDVLSAHLYRVDITSSLPPRDVRGAGLGFAVRSLGARWT